MGISGVICGKILATDREVNDVAVLGLVFLKGIDLVTNSEMYLSKGIL